MICSSVNLDCFIRPSLRWAGLSLPVEEFQGVTSQPMKPGSPPSGVLERIFLWIPDAEAPGVLAVLTYILRQTVLPLALLLTPLVIYVTATHSLPSFEHLGALFAILVFGCMDLVQELNRYAFVRQAERPFRAATIFCTVTICGIVLLYHDSPYTLVWMIAAQLSASAALLWGLQAGIYAAPLVAVIVACQTLVSVAAPRLLPHAGGSHSSPAGRASTPTAPLVDATPPDVGGMRAWAKPYPGATVSRATTLHLLGVTDWRVQYSAHATPEQIRAFYDDLAQQGGFTQQKDFVGQRTYTQPATANEMSVFTLKAGDDTQVVYHVDIHDRGGSAH